jgi:hypothetical protein
MPDSLINRKDVATLSIKHDPLERWAQHRLDMDA